MTLACTDMEQTAGCLRKADGTVQNVIIHTEYAKNSAGNTIVHRIIYTDSSGAPTTLAVGDVVTPGCCPVNQRLTAQLYNVGGPSVPAAQRPDGSVWNLPAGAQAVTVIALTSGLNGAADRIDITTAVGTRTMRASGETMSWSVDGDGDRDLNGGVFTVECFGLGLADIIVTL